MCFIYLFIYFFQVNGHFHLVAQMEQASTRTRLFGLPSQRCFIEIIFFCVTMEAHVVDHSEKELYFHG